MTPSRARMPPVPNLPSGPQQANHQADVRKGLFTAVDDKRTDLAPQILDLLKQQKQTSIVSRAAWALGRLGYREATSDLLRLLLNPQGEVRSWAAWALGEFGNSGLEGLLRTALDGEPSDKVRRVIEGALKKIRLEPTRVIRGQVLRAMRPPKAKEPQIQQLVQRLEKLRWPQDRHEIILLRGQIQQRAPEYFKNYMEWVGRLPVLEAALDDPRKTFE